MTPPDDPSHDAAEQHVEPEDIPAVSAEELVDGVPVGADRGRRRYPSTIGGLCYLLVLVAALVGLGTVVWGPWRLGVQWIGAALIGGAACRVLLPTVDAGMLAVRHKAVDATLLVAVGTVVIVLARTIPNQPG